MIRRCFRRAKSLFKRFACGSGKRRPGQPVALQILGGLRGPSAVCAFQPILIRTFTPHGQTLNRFKEVLDGVVCLVKIHVIFTLLFAARWNHFRACSPQGSNDSAAHVTSLVGNSRFALLARSSECVGALQVARLPLRKVKASGERGFLKRKRESGAQSGSARCSGHLVFAPALLLVCTHDGESISACSLAASWTNTGNCARAETLWLAPSRAQIASKTGANSRG